MKNSKSNKKSHHISQPKPKQKQPPITRHQQRPPATSSKQSIPPSITNIQEILPIRRISKANDPVQQKLKKEFKRFYFLPFQELNKISESMALYIQEKKKNMDHKDGQYVRFCFRNQILKILLLAVAELIVQKAKPANSLEERLFTASANRLEILAVMVHNLQCYLYQQLFNPKETKHRLEPYQCQIKLLITHLYDLNNLVLRRSILNATASYEFIKSATQQQLMSEETKRKEKERMILEVRQSEVWEERDFNKTKEVKVENPAVVKEREERLIYRRWVCEKVEQIRELFGQSRKVWGDRQRDLQEYYGKFKNVRESVT